MNNFEEKGINSNETRIEQSSISLEEIAEKLSGEKGCMIGDQINRFRDMEGLLERKKRSL